MLAIKNFTAKPSNPEGYNWQCKDCMHAKISAKKYNISFTYYPDTLEEQDYRCAMCHIHVNDTTGRLHIDHCHTTGKVRGLLCESCNLVLGKVKDNVVTLERAIKYLNK